MIPSTSVLRNPAFFRQVGGCLMNPSGLRRGRRQFFGKTERITTITGLYYERVYSLPDTNISLMTREVFVPSHNLVITESGVRNARKSNNLWGSFFEGYQNVCTLFEAPLCNVQLSEDLVEKMKQLAIKQDELLLVPVHVVDAFDEINEAIRSAVDQVWGVKR